MADINDTRGQRKGFNDIQIGLKECGGDALDWRKPGLKYYCPDFKEDHFIHGGFSSSMWSWMRLGMHVCDDSPEAEERRIQ